MVCRSTCAFSLGFEGCRVGSVHLHVLPAGLAPDPRVLTLRVLVGRVVVDQAADIAGGMPSAAPLSRMGCSQVFSGCAANRSRIQFCWSAGRSRSRADSTRVAEGGTRQPSPY